MKKINEFYEIEIKESKGNSLGVSAYIINNITGNKMRVPYSLGSVCLVNDNNLQIEELKRTTKSEIEELISHGKIIRMPFKKIWTDYVGVSEEKYLEYIYGSDKRTREYLQKILSNIGFISKKNGYDEENFEILKQYEIWLNLTGSEYVDVGKLENGKYVAQYSFRTDIDDYNITKLYFNHLPAENDIRTVELVHDIENYFYQHRGSYEFTCWECGNSVHWLDTSGDLKTKFNNLTNKYCGC